MRVVVLVEQVRALEHVEEQQHRDNVENEEEIEGQVGDKEKEERIDHNNKPTLYLFKLYGYKDKY